MNTRGKKPQWWKHHKPNPKPIWKHDEWTLHRLYERLKDDPERGKIVLFLKYLRSGMAFNTARKNIGREWIDVCNWVRGYNQCGLQVLLAVECRVPIHFRRRIENYIQLHPKVFGQLTRLTEDEDWEIYGEEIGVEGYALKNWMFECDLAGGKP